MTKDELKAVIKFLMAEYKGFEMDAYRFAIWYEALKGFPPDEVQRAVSNYTITNHWPPAIADIYGLMTQREDSEGEAWAQVLKAIKNSAYHSKEEYAKLPPASQKAIGGPEMLKELAVATDLNLSVESSNFKRAYRAAVEQEKATPLLDKNIKKRLEQSGFLKLE